MADLPRSVGLVAVGRPTFDLDWGRERAASAAALLASAGVEVVGRPEPITEPDGVAAAVRSWTSAPDRVVVVQATFTDSRFVAAAAGATDADLAVWALPEHRGGGRLRSNSLCGLVLASYAVANEDRSLRWIYLDPEAGDAGTRLAAWLAEPAPQRPPIGAAAGRGPGTTERGRGRAGEVARRLRTARIGIVGEPPPGFEPCLVHPRAEVAGPRYQSIPMDGLLDRVRHEHDRPAALHRELGALAADRDALAVRCWPEVFDDLGCAACAAMARLNEDGRPAGCEADALGAVTMLVLGWLGDSRPFLADLVDIDPPTGTAAVWHCGVAPADVAAPGTVRIAPHPNRGLPPVQMLALRPGPATVARFTQSRGVMRLAIGRVDVLDEPCPYLGSGGIVRFGRPVEGVLETVIDEGLEHHVGLVYGDVTDELRALAAELGLPVVEL